VKIADGVFALELTMDFLGNQTTIYPSVITDASGTTLIDTGMPGHLDAIKAAMEAHGIPFNSVNRIILTHQDIDHIGSLPDAVWDSQGPAIVLAHVEDKPYIEGEKTPIKMDETRMAERLASAPAEIRDAAMKMFENPPSANVDVLLADGDTLDILGGVEVIFTPGHTPGHICLFVREAKVLIAGDELRVENGQLVGPSPTATPDMPLALKSLKKLTAYPIEYVLCYHGGLFGPNASTRIAELAEQA